MPESKPRAAGKGRGRFDEPWLVSDSNLIRIRPQGSQSVICGLHIRGREADLDDADRSDKRRRALDTGARIVACVNALAGVDDVDAWVANAKYLVARSSGAEPRGRYDVLEERRRQVDEEGFTTSHDDEHDTGELARAGVCYALDDHKRWPWSFDWWKPSPDRRRNLVKAAALLIAEIERLDRILSRRGS